MNDPQQRWDEQLRAALTEQAGSIEAVTPWAPPTDRRRTGRHPWRWLTPLVAAAAVVLIVVGATVARIAAGRDVRPASPIPPTTVIATVTPTTPSVAPTTASVAPTAPTSSGSPYPTSPTRARTPVVPGPSTVTPVTPVTPVPATVTSTAPGASTHATVPAPTTVPPAPATGTPCMRSYTYENLTAHQSPVNGTQFFGLTELARCGGADDVNWFPTGHPFPLRLSSTTRILVLRPGGNGDQSLPLAKFADYLSHPVTGLFLITGPSAKPTAVTEMYHP